MIQLYIYTHIHILFQILFNYRLYVLYSRSLLFICFIYSSMYLIIPNSQFIPGHWNKDHVRAGSPGDLGKDADGGLVAKLCLTLLRPHRL